jgi:hypothetical protein
VHPRAEMTCLPPVLRGPPRSNGGGEGASPRDIRLAASAARMLDDAVRKADAASRMSEYRSVQKSRIDDGQKSPAEVGPMTGLCGGHKARRWRSRFSTNELVALIAE